MVNKPVYAAIIIILAALFAGCASHQKASVEISCGEGYSLDMGLPYSEAEWKMIHDKGESWMAFFRCVKEE